MQKWLLADIRISVPVCFTHPARSLAHSAQRPPASLPPPLHTTSQPACLRARARLAPAPCRTHRHQPLPPLRSRPPSPPDALPTPPEPFTASHEVRRCPKRSGSFPPRCVALWSAPAALAAAASPPSYPQSPRPVLQMATTSTHGARRQATGLTLLLLLIASAGPRAATASRPLGKPKDNSYRIWSPAGVVLSSCWSMDANCMHTYPTTAPSWAPNTVARKVYAAAYDPTDVAQQWTQGAALGTHEAANGGAAPGDWCLVSGGGGGTAAGEGSVSAGWGGRVGGWVGACVRLCACVTARRPGTGAPCSPSLASPPAIPRTSTARRGSRWRSGPARPHPTT